MSSNLCQEPISTGITNGALTYEPCGRPLKKGFCVCKDHFKSAEYTYRSDTKESKEKRIMAAKGSSA